MMYPRKRKLSALILLITMAMNFALEGASLYAAYGPRLFPAKAEAVSCKAPAAGGKSSCCSAKKVPVKKSCGCPHCGDHCPMGDACTCDHEGKQTVKQGDGLFFRLPGCHSDGNDLSGNYLPLSMRVIFLVSEDIIAESPAMFAFTLREATSYWADTSMAPPSPPPKRLTGQPAA